MLHKTIARWLNQ